jgi:ADP-heptose:LPS heptosyltransferase
MGDVAMTVPVLVGLTRNYPNLKITVLTKSFFAPLFLDLTNVTVHIADVKGKHKGILGLWKLFREFNGLKLDGVADLHHVLRSTILKQFFRLRSIPFNQIDKGRAEKRQLIDPKRATLHSLRTTHQRYADVFEKLGYPIALRDMDILSRKPLSEPLLKLCEANNRVLIGIAPFAAFEGKMYPLSLMENVIQQLIDTNKYKIILFGGGKKEAAILSNWESQYGNVINAADKFPFSDELSLVSNLELMLAMDSGNAHLSAMYGVPTLTLWGVTHPFAGFFPYGQPESNALLADRNRYPLIPTSIYGNKFPAGYGNVMETIKPNEVVEKIEEIMKVSS